MVFDVPTRFSFSLVLIWGSKIFFVKSMYLLHPMGHLNKKTRRWHQPNTYLGKEWTENATWEQQQQQPHHLTMIGNCNNSRTRFIHGLCVLGKQCFSTGAASSSCRLENCFGHKRKGYSVLFTVFYCGKAFRFHIGYDERHGIFLGVTKEKTLWMNQSVSQLWERNKKTNHFACGLLFCGTVIY